MGGSEAKHVFISYVTEDSERIDTLCRILTSAGIPYWRDRTDLGPGDEWKQKIRTAIRDGALAFVACFSSNSLAKTKSYMNEELTLAAEEFRQYTPGHTWLIPVRLDDITLPEWDLGAGRTLADLNYVSLFGDSYTEQAVALTTKISQLLGQPALDSATAQAAVAEASDQDRPTMLRRLTKDLILNPERRIELDDVIAQESGHVLAAIRDIDRFPTDRAGLSGDEWVVRLVNQAQDYWELTQPMCWSLQVAARWAEPDTLRTWVNAVRAIVAEATKQRAGYQEAIDLRYVPGLCLTVTTAIAATAQGRWDNLRALVIDNTVPAPYQGQAPILRVVTPHAPFPSSPPWVQNTLARAAIHNEDGAVALAQLTGKQVGTYRTPEAEWLHHVLRSAFQEQFPDDGEYDRAYDYAEVVLGVLSQDDADNQTDRGWGSRWFGRSTWRSGYGHGHPVEDLQADLEAHGASWHPLKAGLFGSDPGRAKNAVDKYAESFERLRYRHS